MNNRLRLIGTATQIMVMAIFFSIFLLLLGIGILILIHFCIVGRAFRRSLTAIRHERQDDSNTGLSPDDLKKLPCYDYNVVNDTGQIDCVVCLESFRVGDRCKLLPLCKHSFHAKCVDSWLLKSPICPICRSVTNYPKNATHLEEEQYDLESGETLSVVVENAAQ